MRVLDLAALTHELDQRHGQQLRTADHGCRTRGDGPVLLEDAEQAVRLGLERSSELGRPLTHE